MYLPGKQRSIPIVLEIGSFTTRAGIYLISSKTQIFLQI